MLLDQRGPLERAVPRRWNLVVVPLAVLLLSAAACVRAEPGDEPGATKSATNANQSSAAAPFSGRIWPGDILKIEMAGGYPGAGGPERSTVEPDGNVAMGALYGRVRVGGMTLQQAEVAIQQHLSEILKDPQVQVTYVGHDFGVVAAKVDGAAEVNPPSSAAPEPPHEAGAPLLPPVEPLPDLPAAESPVPPLLPEEEPPANEPLQPLDTVEIILPLRPRVHRTVVDGKVGEEDSGQMPAFSGTYVIEPNGDIALPHGYGRVNVKEMDTRQAGAAIRDRLSEKLLTRTALPTVHVVKRGRAVFPDGKEPPADYRIRNGDSLLIGSPSHESTFNFLVDLEGDVGTERKIKVEGMTLPEVEDALRQGWKQPKFPGQEPEIEVPWYVTIGGWHEEADPEVIDRLEGSDGTRIERLERELQEIKQLIRARNP